MACFCCNRTENFIFSLKCQQRKVYTSKKSLVFVRIWQKISSLRPAILYENSIFTQKYALAERYIKPTKISHAPIKVVHAISWVIYLNGKRSIALCGQKEELDDSKPDDNPDNFLSILTEVVHYYPVLQEHLEEPFRKDVTYLSPTSQNEMIDIIGRNIIQATLVDGVKKLECTQFLPMRLLPPMTKYFQFASDI